MSANIEKELDFADYDKDEPEESKAAAKAAKKAADGKVAKKVVDAKEKNFQDAIAEKAAKETAQKEIDTILAGLKPDQKAKLLAAQGVVAAASVTSKAKYDHETTKKNLVKNTAPVRALMETHKDDYDAVYYMCSLSTHYMSLHNINEPENKIKKNAHAAFAKYFKKYQHEHGLPPATPSSAGSKTSSRTASRAASVIDEGSMEENESADEDTGAGAA